MHGWKPYSDMHRERIRAHDKHDARDGSMERKDWTNPIWLPVLVEEVGEIARVLCDAELKVLDGEVAARLREELVQVGAMTAAWIEAVDAAARERHFRTTRTVINDLTDEQVDRLVRDVFATDQYDIADFSHQVRTLYSCPKWSCRWAIEEGPHPIGISTPARAIVEDALARHIAIHPIWRRIIDRRVRRKKRAIS